MDDLKNIIKEIQSYKEFKFTPSDDMILDYSTRIFINQNIQKDKLGFKKAEKVEFEPATDKQKYFMSKVMNLSDEEINNISLDEAKGIISEYKGGK
jgi:hypothetical protein